MGRVESVEDNSSVCSGSTVASEKVADDIKQSESSGQSYTSAFNPHVFMPPQSISVLNNFTIGASDNIGSKQMNTGSKDENILKLF